MGRTDIIHARYTASAALTFHVLMAITAIIAILMTVPEQESAPTARTA